MASSVSCIPASSRSTSTTKAPSRANNTALARPMPEPAPVTTAIRSFSRMSHSFSVTNQPLVQIGGGIRAAEAGAPAEFLRHPRDREGRAIRIAMQINRRHFAGSRQTADEAGIEIGKMLSPLQRGPLIPGRYIVEAMPGLWRLDQHG